MKRWTTPLVAAALAGCASPLLQFSAPASAGSLHCAVREAEEMGYQRLEGAAEEGVVRLGRHIPPPPAREPTDPAVRLSDRQGPRPVEGPFETQIRVSERRGQLRVAVLTAPDSDAAQRDPGGPAGDARMILAACSATG